MPDSSQEAISFTLKLILCSYFCAIIRTICFQVLDAGKIHAYDEPYTLLQDPTNIFYKMVQQTGKQEAAALLEAAKKVSLFSLSVKNLSHSFCKLTFVNYAFQAYDSRSRPSLSNGHAVTADGNLVIFETAL